MVRLEIAGDELKVRFGPLDALAALRLPFSVPVSSIRGATADRGIISNLGIRSPGTGLPFLISAGTFYSKGDRQFVHWKAGQQVVVIELDHPYWTRLIIGCSDAVELERIINRELKK